MSARKAGKPATPSIDSPELLTRKEVAEFLRTTDQFVDRLTARGLLPTIRFGFGARKQVRIRRSDLLRYLDKHAD